MLSKFLRKILVIAFQIAVFNLVAVSAFAQSPAAEDLSVFRIEQVRINMPEIRVFVQGASEEISCEAYLDGQALADAGTRSLDEDGTSYLVMLDVSGSIGPDYFISAKNQILELAKSLNQNDKITLITFGDSVKMWLSNSRDVRELEAALDSLDARDQKTCLYEAFEQCLDYAESTAQEERQIVLVISDGIQDTGSVGVTQEEIEAQLAQASMPVYSFCVDTADKKAQEEFGRFARTTGGGFATFDPENASQVWQDWHADLMQTRVFCFEGSTNDVDGKLHTVLLKMTANGQNQNDTRQIRITNWVKDTIPPSITGCDYDKKQNVLELRFSEPVLGADELGAYELQKSGKTWKLKGAVSKSGECYQLLLPDQLPFGTYVLRVSNVCDDSMEKNPLTENQITFHKAFAWSDARPFLIAGFVIVIGCGGLIWFRKNSKDQKNRPVSVQKVEYQVQHVAAIPTSPVSSPADAGQMGKLVLEIVGGVQSGQQIETMIHKSAIWGRSPEMCDLSFEDRRISKQHCAFEVQGKAVLLSDLGSQNGTYVNGIRVTNGMPVHRGDTIQMGNTILRIVEIAV